MCVSGVYLFPHMKLKYIGKAMSPQKLAQVEESFSVVDMATAGGSEIRLAS